MKIPCVVDVLTAALILFALAVPPSARAHCDSLDGPVIEAAQKALASGDANLVLIWVQKGDEPEIKKAFQKTLAVRKLNSEAKELADLYFFETLVRVHRAGEGAPYTGLKPAGHDLGPAIPAADMALREENIGPVTKLLTETLRDGVQEHFNEVLKRKHFAKDDVEAGRQFVKAYVEYIHCVEALYAQASRSVHGHFPDTSTGSHSHEE